MKLHALAIPASIAVALAGAAATAHAQPAPPPCDFTLSAPQVVQVSGTNMVTATVRPAACHVAATPHLSVACLQIEGSQTAPNCESTQGPSTAQVYVPYRPGATYVATGKGCANTGNPPRSLCDTQGPTAASL
ncbi:hypothetical protein [Mycobacterium hubeiense]|uniref:hypothetical protein n=1 Tax=Mycobacterium hubeiense TaxID=1867256 RepID=UPI000C7F2459|nr:hypothetical protein [Mycobacterium sp. QGD 101]